jgi:transketolase
VRKAFVETLMGLAAKDERIVLLTADIGFNALEPFAAKFPERFFNVGVAEQNMIAVATGLAEAGFRPYCYSIASFAVLRPYEFIRNGPILHALPVRIVGMGGGLEYGPNGLSHYGIEDLALLRTQPGISIFAPADSPQTRRIIEQTADLPGPIYYRLEKDDSLLVPGLDGHFAMGRPEHVVAGHDVLLVCVGGISADVIAAAHGLNERAISAGVAVVSSLAPLEAAEFAELLRRYPTIVTVEAHQVNGGLGSLVAEIMAEARIPGRLVRKGIASAIDGVTGTRATLHRHHGISCAALIDAVVALHRPTPVRIP